MSKNFDDRVDTVLGTIKAVDNGLGVRIETYYTNQPVATREAISKALSYGWRGFGDKDADETTARARRRAIVLLRMLFDNLDESTAKKGLDNANGLAYTLNQAVQQGGRRSFAHQLDLTHMRGRMEVIGVVNNNNRNRQWFTDQYALYDHFHALIPTVQADRRGVYRAALASAGLISWAPNEPTPQNAQRFDQFPRASPMCRLDNGQTMQLNCWEAFLFWAYKDGKFTPAKGKKLYAKNGDMMAALFGMQTPFSALTAVPGDILTYHNAGHVNHVAMYAGIGPGPANLPYVFHCLATDQNSVQYDYATTHFLSQADMLAFYQSMYGVATPYQNTPFWMGTAATNAYYNAL
ncbi:MAG: hypothetical protein WAQ05_18535 [Rubrivivax sp.]